MTGRFIGYEKLVDACGREGCPVCRCVDDDGRRHLDALLHEHVTDPETRRRLRASWGFCNWHTWMLLEVAGARSGAAILYEDLARVLMQRLRRLRPMVTAGTARSWRERVRSALRRRRPPAPGATLRARRRCPVCVDCAAAESRYVETLVRFCADAALAAAYGKSDGLCAPHLVHAIEHSIGSASLESLLDRTLTQWQATRERLQRFIEKHDYRNTMPFTEAEASSCLRAFEMLAGRPGVHGNDLHAAVTPRPRASTPERT